MVFIEDSKDCKEPEFGVLMAFLKAKNPPFEMQPTPNGLRITNETSDERRQIFFDRKYMHYVLAQESEYLIRQLVLTTGVMNAGVVNWQTAIRIHYANPNCLDEIYRVLLELDS